VARRAAHGAPGFEGGLTLLLVPVMAWGLDTSLLNAFLANVALLAFFFFYAIGLALGLRPGVRAAAVGTSSAHADIEGHHGHARHPGAARSRRMPRPRCSRCSRITAIYEFENDPLLRRSGWPSATGAWRRAGQADGFRAVAQLGRAAARQRAWRDTLQASVLPSAEASVAYELGSAHWRQGVGSSAVRAMLEELRAPPGVRTFVAVLNAANFQLRGAAARPRLRAGGCWPAGPVAAMSPTSW
jgi:hypothetical protein